MTAKCPHCGAELYECTDEGFENRDSNVYQVTTEYYCEICYVYWYPHEVTEIPEESEG